MIEDTVEMFGGQEAQVGRTRSRRGGVRLKLVPHLVQVDLLRPEYQCMASLAERLCPHPEHRRVKRDGSVDVSDCQDEMIKVIDSHQTRMSCIGDHHL